VKALDMPYLIARASDLNAYTCLACLGGSDWSARGDGSDDVGLLCHWYASLLLTLLLPAEGGREESGRLVHEGS